MLTEDDARVLLREAAATVDVGAATESTAIVRRARNRRRVLLLSVAAGAVTAVAAITAVTRADLDNSPSRPPAPNPEMVAVPNLTGLTQQAAVRIVRDRGLKPRVSVEPARCVPIGEVIGTRPQAGARLTTRATLVVVVSSGGPASPPAERVCPGGTAAPRDRALAADLLSLADKPGQASVSFASEVRLGLGDQVNKKVSGRALRDPATWRICAPYAERSCPFSAMATLAGMGEVTVNATRDPEDTCYAGDAPAALAGRRVVRIESVLPAIASCIEYASVDVYRNVDGKVTAVVLRLGSP